MSAVPHAPVPDASFRLILTGLDSTLDREAQALEAYRRVAAASPGGRLGDDVAYAQDELERALALVRKGRAVLAALAEHEPEVRALLAARARAKAA